MDLHPLILALQLLGVAAPPQDVRPVVKIVFEVRHDHPYVLPFRRTVSAFKRTTAEKLVDRLPSHAGYLRFSPDSGANTLYFLLEHEDADVAEGLRRLRLYAAMNRPATGKEEVAWTVREAGTDNKRIGSAKEFSTEIAASIDKDILKLESHYFKEIALSDRATKPPQSAYWLLPFDVAQLEASERSIFLIWSTGTYKVAPVAARPAVANAFPDFPGTTEATQEAQIKELEKAGLMNARRVSMETFIKRVPQQGGQPPPGVPTGRP